MSAIWDSIEAGRSQDVPDDELIKGMQFTMRAQSHKSALMLLGMAGDTDTASLILLANRGFLR